MKDGWYWYNTPWACGGVKVAKGLIVDACPIYRKMIGWQATAMRKHEYQLLDNKRTFEVWVS